MLNRTILVGRLTRDIELRYSQAQKAVANFTIAVNRNFKNQQGETDVDFINIVVWGKQAENAHKYVSKGSLVGIDGRIQQRQYQAQDGSNRYVFEVVAESIQFLDSKKEQTRPTTEQVKQQMNNDPFGDFGSSIEIKDSDLPF